MEMVTSNTIHMHTHYIFCTYTNIRTHTRTHIQTHAGILCSLDQLAFCVPLASWHSAFPWPAGKSVFPWPALFPASIKVLSFVWFPKLGSEPSLSTHTHTQQLMDVISADDVLRCLKLLAHANPEDLNMVHGHPDYCGPLHLACQQGRTVIMQLLVWVGHCKNGSIPFHIPFHSIPVVSIPFHMSTFHSIPFHSILFHSIPFYSILFHSIPFHIPFHSCGLYSIPHVHIPFYFIPFHMSTFHSCGLYSIPHVHIPFNSKCLFFPYVSL